jgi:hypothetical protein
MGTRNLEMVSVGAAFKSGSTPQIGRFQSAIWRE